jgi:hypothetical protein
VIATDAINAKKDKNGSSFYCTDDKIENKLTYNTRFIYFGSRKMKVGSIVGTFFLISIEKDKKNID